MANIAVGGGVTDIRGSIGGTTFARGRGGLYARARVKPLNPKTALQVNRRAVQSAAAAAWSSLTAAQRTAWNSYALNTSWTNKLGQSINIGGSPAFTRLYTLMVLAAEPAPSNAPTLDGHASGTVGTISASAGAGFPALQLPTIGWNKDLDGDLLLIFATPPYSQSRAAMPKAWRFVIALQGSSGVPESFPYGLTQFPFPFVVDQKIGIAYVHIDPQRRVSVRNHVFAIAGM